MEFLFLVVTACSMLRSVKFWFSRGVPVKRTLEGKHQDGVCSCDFLSADI